MKFFNLGLYPLQGILKNKNTLQKPKKHYKNRFLILNPLTCYTIFRLKITTRILTILSKEITMKTYSMILASLLLAASPMHAMEKRNLIANENTQQREINNTPPSIPTRICNALAGCALISLNYAVLICCNCPQLCKRNDNNNNH